MRLLQMIPMLPEEADALVNAYYRRFMTRKQNKPLTPEEEKTLAEIENRLEELVKAVDKGSGCFLRLSTRSPKDAALASPENVASMMSKLLSDAHKVKLTKTLSNQLIGGFPADALYDPAATLTLNEKLQCLFQLFYNVLKIRSGAEGMQLLLDSERVYVDLLSAQGAVKANELPDSGDPVDFRMNYIVREWVDIPIGLEFRGFVFNVRLRQIYFDLN